MTRTRHRHPAYVHSEKEIFPRGFTLVELMVSMVIGAMAIATIISLFSMLQSNQRNVWYLDVATRAARSEIETARTKGVDLLPKGDTDIKSRLPPTLPADATGILNVGPVLYEKSRLVTVTITWQGGAKKVTLSGVVGQKGIIP
jgi:prepilin-type N-terminal cleavage/methylation domain-containing protein